MFDDFFCVCIDNFDDYCVVVFVDVELKVIVEWIDEVVNCFYNVF